ncbi:MAG: serine hydrolase domain-containing protein [Candidatus Saccharicenans sp.]|uniref:serine hydrolase domain-containing protein n=1 Tax=Candidatus Saccharicenans sp. TaxID=2819258 RepID=UPI00404A307C
MGKNDGFNFNNSYLSCSFLRRILIKHFIPLFLFITAFWLLLPSGLSAACPAPLENNQVKVIKENIKFPDTVAGRKAEMFWKAFEAEDRAALEAFFEQVLPEEKLLEMPASQRAQRLLGLRQKLGAELKVLRMLATGSEEIIIIISNQQNNFFRLSLAFEKQGQELRLKSLTIDEAGPEDLASPLPAMSLARALQGIEEEIGRAVQEDRFSGVVLIARDFQPIFFKPYGLASKEFIVPNQRHTKFNLGSINKIFTKIAIARLAQEGRLSLDDRLGKFLPDYPNAEAREKVTVWHLVNMTSGIGDFFGPGFQSTPKDLIRHNRDYLRFFAGQPLAFEPGSKEMYSNGGYVVLGEIISVASGMVIMIMSGKIFLNRPG